MMHSQNPSKVFDIILYADTQVVYWQKQIKKVKVNI